VDALTEAAGLTHGSLYSQFGSKERLIEEALGHAVAGSTAKLGGIGTLADYAAQYLSEEHRDRPGGGCALAALACEMPRQGAEVRHRFTEGVRNMVTRLARLMLPGPRREEEALAVAAMMVGGLMLARAVDDPALSARILAAARDAVDREGR
jgi:TetR/AcrR family transcriptional repressor of nem operon